VESSTGISPSPPVLDYGRRNTRRRGARLIFLAIIAITSGLFIWKGPIWQFLVMRYEVARLHRIEQRVVTMDIPADTLLYDGDAYPPARSHALTNARSELALMLSMQCPPRLDPFMQWPALQKPTSLGPTGVVVMNVQLVSPHGKRYNASLAVGEGYIVARTWRPGTWLALPSAIPNGFAVLDIQRITMISQLRIYPGRRDPADASRFVLPYKYEQNDGQLRGVIGEDGSLKFEGEGVKSAAYPGGGLVFSPPRRPD
jgi:hypothetical protein